MPPFNRLTEWLRDPSLQRGRWFGRQPLPPIAFAEIRAVDRPPRNEDIQENTFYFVSSRRHPKWALFQCPCGCNNIVTLSLQKAHRPHWVLRKNRRNRPSLQPSVWRDVGCLSHFWLQDGRVYWCYNSGTSPNDANESNLLLQRLNTNSAEEGLLASKRRNRRR